MSVPLPQRWWNPPAPVTVSLATVLALLVFTLPVPASTLTYPIQELELVPELLTFERRGAGVEEGVSGDVAADPVAIRYRGAIRGPAGAPDLPRLPVWVEVPAGMRVIGIVAEAVGVEELGRVRVRPVAPDRRPGDPAPVAVPDRAIYEGAGMYPREWAAVGSEGSLRGHRVVAIEVSPVRWEPRTGRLVRASRVRFELELAPGSGPAMLERHRVVREIEARFETAAGRFIRGFEPAAAGGGSQQLVGAGPAGPGPFQPTFRPTPDGSAVEYVIVTSEELAPEFQRLADWKTRKGVQAVVRTVEWIDQTYPNGVDRAERVRFFIRDAYQNWGTLFALLGGDTDVVPPRYAQMIIFDSERIPADYYYACLDGNWNADGDSRFAESLSDGSGDEADFFFEVSIGRAPASTAAEAANFVDKVILYDLEPPAGPRYPHSIVVLAERLFPATHGAQLAEEALALLPPWFQVARVYEESESYPGSVELTRQSAIDSINAGFGIVHHVGHGYRNSMSVGSGNLNNADADNLTNAPRNSLVFAINCSSASIDFNTIGERWVKNPNGGSVAYIGTSRLAFVNAAQSFQNEWYRMVFVDSVTTVGLATDLSRAVFIPQAGFDGSPRWHLLATTLLGDPEVDLYTNEVIPLQVAHPAGVAIGSAPITVTVTAQGAPVDSATVTLWRAGEAYARATTAASGTAELPVTADTPGSIILTVHKSYYRVYTDTLEVTTAGGPYLFVQEFTVDDDTSGSSSGDGDGMADAGETIELRVTLRNGGGATATGVVGDLTAADPENALTITQGTVSYGTLADGGASAGSGAFVITIDGTAPVAYQPILTLTANGNEGSWEDPIALPLRRSYLEHHGHEVDDAAPRGNGNGQVESGEEIHYRVTLRNTGQDQASGVSGALRALDAASGLPHPEVTVIDGSSSFGTIAAGAEAEGDRFIFILDGAADPLTVLLELTLSDDLGQVDLQLIDVQPPLTPEAIVAFGSPTSIRLEWDRSTSEDAKGYDVFRSSNPGGPFARINPYTADGSAAYEDADLTPLTRYYYQVVARDSSYNASVPSAVVSGTTNPPYATGWPIELGQQTSSSPIIVDIDGGPRPEILTGAQVMYAWHGNAIEVVDGDNDPRTNGPFSLRGESQTTSGFAAIPTAGNLEGFGDDLAVANVGFTVDSLYVWNNQGEILPGWPKSVMSDSNWGPCLMDDLDQDGDLEIVVWVANGLRLFAWHHDGTELVDGDQNPATDGVLAQLTGSFWSFNYAGPTVGQLDQDPELEIVVAVHKSLDTSGGVYAFNIDGSGVPGWPFFTGGGGHFSEVSASPAVADLDRDGDEEVVIACERDGGRIYVLDGDGTVVPGWPRSVIALTPAARIPSPVVADLDGDTLLDIIYPGTDGRLWAFDHQGAILPGFPATFFASPPSQATQSTPSVGDIDGDGQMEILFGDEARRVHAYNHDGTLAAGFPIQLGGEIHATPALGDVDLDGRIEVVVVGFDANVYVWDLPVEFVPARIPWPMFRHDPMNTGRFATAIPEGPAGVEEPAAAPGVAAATFHPARPNPFNPHTALAFEVPGEAGGARLVVLGIYDINGRLVRRLVDGLVETGRHEVSWDGRGAGGGTVASGVYLARIEIGSFVGTQKLTMVR